MGGVLPGGAVAVHVTPGYRPAPVGAGGPPAAPDCEAGVEQPVP